MKALRPAIFCAARASGALLAQGDFVTVPVVPKASARHMLVQLY